MRGKRIWAVALMSAGIVVVPCRADLRIACKETSSAGAATRVDYYKGNLWRTDWGAGATYTIVDFGSKRSVTIDPAGHTYSVHTFTPDAPTADSSRMVTVEIEAQDTGEQRQMFGHVTHHILTTQRWHTVSQGRSMADDREMTIDGWYMNLNLPSPPLSRANSVAAPYVAIDQHGRSDVPKIQIIRKGSVPHGLPVCRYQYGAARLKNHKNNSGDMALRTGDPITFQATLDHHLTRWVWKHDRKLMIFARPRLANGCRLARSAQACHTLRTSCKSPDRSVEFQAL